MEVGLRILDLLPLSRGINYGEGLTASSDGGEDAEGGEHGNGCTDDDFHGVVGRVEWGSGTVRAKGDKVGWIRQCRSWYVI